MKKTPLIERFWPKVDVKGKDDCWSGKVTDKNRNIAIVFALLFLTGCAQIEIKPVLLQPVENINVPWGYRSDDIRDYDRG